ncbi:baseplate J/gp47 family protein [Conexibacter stalactiti]|uniref:Baseplate J/gp47 family protein n=1 Tax=Conexibacter stalactiti TaxID=1940611 RepID=A0ABU4HWK0_9ACTN|nr:baseplate J/gp47 family protein [Conexibacter stalactiti]MDW5597656.1 baseplate J/gp47 family protein [Conexibacter stalactiti]MEC5038298.1 baseplate J/gp47 family protein [Conexibacter stalactiti]
MAVIRPEIETDPAELEQVAIDYLQEAVPGWEPADGDLMTWLIAAHARMVAEERDIAADVPLEQILRPLGEQVHLVAPKLALPATVDAVVTMRDQAGYTVPQGTEVLVRTAGDDGVTMVVVRAVTLEPNRGLTVPIELQAAPGREGSAGNGLDDRATVVPIRQLEFIGGIAIAQGAVSANGRDAETDEEYLQRLVDTLALSSPTPILPEDFAAIARQVDGVERALALNLLHVRPQIITLTGSSFRGSLWDNTTEIPLDYGNPVGPGEVPVPPATAIRNGLQNKGYDVEVTGGPSVFTLTLIGRPVYGPWRVTSGGPAVAVVQATSFQTPVERTIAVAVVDDEGASPPPSVRQTVRAALESLREVNWTVSVIEPEYTDITVQFRAVTWPGYEPEPVRLAAVDAVVDYLSAKNWGRGRDGWEDGDVTWVDEPFVRYLEIAQVLNEVPGLRYVESVRIAKGSDTATMADVQLVGRARLPRTARESITGTVIEG